MFAVVIQRVYVGVLHTRVLQLPFMRVLHLSKKTRETFEILRLPLKSPADADDDNIREVVVRSARASSHTRCAEPGGRARVPNRREEGCRRRLSLQRVALARYSGRGHDDPRYSAHDHTRVKKKAI